MDVHYLHFDVLDSTNTWAKNHAHEFNLEALTCITAQEQTAGRGTFKRSWISPKGGLYATLFFGVPRQALYLPNIGQILAYSCVMLLQQEGFPVKIKWPNDLLIHKKKIAGILTEIVDLKNCLGVALGLGLNVAASEEDLASINQPAASLMDFSRKALTGQGFLPFIVKYFLENLSILKEKSFSFFQPDFEKCLAYKGEEITLKIENQPIKGICEGITEDGKLKFLLPSGERLQLLNIDINSFF